MSHPMSTVVTHARIGRAKRQLTRATAVSVQTVRATAKALALRNKPEIPTSNARKNQAVRTNTTVLGWCGISAILIALSHYAMAVRIIDVKSIHPILIIL